MPHTIPCTRLRPHDGRLRCVSGVRNVWEDIIEIVKDGIELAAILITALLVTGLSLGAVVGVFYILAELVSCVIKACW